MADELLIAAVVLFIHAVIWFAIALRLKKNDVADIAWGLSFILAAIAALSVQERATVRAALVALLVVLWGARLALHIGLRSRGKPEDARYRSWREAWGRHAVIRSFVQVFLLQSLLALIISLPVIAAIAADGPAPGLIDLSGVLLFFTGFFFEAVGDHQLAKFKRDPANRGKIMQQGLWRYTRHPNYFGEVVLWWGIYLLALPVPGGWMTIIGPLTITGLILLVSGIPLLEKKYEGNAEFEAYKRRTSVFFPLPPREG